MTACYASGMNADATIEALFERLDTSNPDIAELIKLVRSLQANKKQADWVRRYILRKEHTGQLLALDEAAIGALLRSA
jgi:hypothetical protein